MGIGIAGGLILGFAWGLWGGHCSGDLWGLYGGEAVMIEDHQMENQP